MQEDLIKIKKYYGEAMAHLARKLFPTILEEEGLLFKLIYESFAPSRFLYEDIINNHLENSFKSYIYSFIDNNSHEIIVDKSPQELLKMAGYNLYECKNEDDIQKFKKYYADNEELCTFKGGRLNTDYVFFATKDNALELDRKKFGAPKREDEYGVSVISIQFAKGKINTLSIKNRYNHTVFNADATFENNLENIIPGLTHSFENEYELNIKSNFHNLEIPNYRKDSNGRYYKYNYEINNICYCIDNYIIDNGKIITKYRDKSRYLFVDYFIFDMHEKRIICYDKNLDDSFYKHFKSNMFKKLEIRKMNNKKIIHVYFNDEDVIIHLDNYNRIIYYENLFVQKIEDDFLKYNEVMEEIKIDNVYVIGNGFLLNNQNMKKIKLDKLVSMGRNFLLKNQLLEEFSAENLEILADNFLYNNRNLYNLNTARVKLIGDRCLSHNVNMEKLVLPNVTNIGMMFLEENKLLSYMYAPILQKVDKYFLANNNCMKYLDMPSLEIIGDYFFRENNSLLAINFPKVKIIGSSFLEKNKCLIIINMPLLEQVDYKFLFSNENLKYLFLPNLINVGFEFLYNNKIINMVYLPKLEKIENDFLYWNIFLKKLYLPSVLKVGNNFCHSNEMMEEFIAPKLNSVGELTFRFNKKLKYIKTDINCSLGYFCFDAHECADEIRSSIMSDGEWHCLLTDTKKLIK